MTFKCVSGVAAACAAALFVSAGAASADTVVPGIYRLHNHPDGNARDPLYGARLDELYDVTSGHDIFTFDFDHSSAAMFLEYTGTEIHIWGQAYGGRDIGSSYAGDVHQGVYVFDFLYNLGVTLEPGDDDVIVEPPPSAYNYGTMLTPSGVVVELRDGHYDGAQRDFRFGDEDNDLGHRGFDGLSGWGWLFHRVPGGSFYPYTADSDWLFTAELIPAPGTLLSLAGLLGLAGRRRR